MKRLNEILLVETYKNLFTGDIDLRTKYVDQIWDILQKSYVEIGGISGSGFRNKEDMIKNIPFWKLMIRNDTVKAVVMYKDKSGRKLVATGTDGSIDALNSLKTSMAAELKRSFGERSGKALGLLMKSISPMLVKEFVKTPKESSVILNKELRKVDPSMLNKDDKYTWDRFKDLRPFFYIREIGGDDHMKIMFGSENKTIN